MNRFPSTHSNPTSLGHLRSLGGLRVAALTLVVAASTGLAGCRDIEAIEAPPPESSLSAREKARVALGQRLFFDARLSADGTVACASCHVPTEGGDDGRAVSSGIAEQKGRRNAPTVLNVAFKEHLFWDGRAGTLELQSLMPLRAADEMGADDATLLALLEGDDDYRRAFADAFDEGEASMKNIAVAIAAYERRLVAPSRVDAFLAGDEGALDAREQRGMSYFRSNCAFCHDGPGIGGRRFEKLGDETPWPVERTRDLGRYEITGDESDKLVFAVPQLRHVADTAPYFHDGSVETLEEAVELMARHQLGEELTDDEIADIVAFLKALSGTPDAALLVDPTAR